MLIVTTSEPVFSTLVRAFYSRAIYDMGGLITSTFRGVEIRLDPESIDRIFNIARLDSKYTSLRCGPLCWVLSLERLFKIFVDF